MPEWVEERSMEIEIEIEVEVEGEIRWNWGIVSALRSTGCSRWERKHVAR
jgi:hypothetical protein